MVQMYAKPIAPYFFKKRTLNIKLKKLQTIAFEQIVCHILSLKLFARQLLPPENKNISKRQHIQNVNAILKLCTHHDEYDFSTKEKNK